jgi:signal peptidase I
MNRQTNKRISWRRLLLLGATLALGFAAWALLAPPLLGGSSSYVITAGASMEPRFRTGDLAIVRRADSYRAGEIVAYRSQKLRTVVLHRIVARDGERYVFKGDNNGWLDPEHPVRDDLIGKLWLRVPAVGKAMTLSTPRNVALLAGAAVLLLLGGAGAMTHRRRRRRRREQAAQAGRAPSPRALAGAQLLAAVSLLALLGSLALGALAFTRPLAKPVSHSVFYRQTGAFSYTAAARAGTVYAGGRLTTGQPIYLRLVDRVRVRFDYALKAEAPRATSGTAGFAAELAEASGWKRTLRLGPRVSFAGDRANLRGTLRLDRVRTLMQSLERATGAANGSYTLTLVPQVRLAGTLAGEKLAARFEPRLQFALDKLKLTPELADRAGSLNPESKPARPLSPSATGSVKVSRTAANELAARKVHLPVATARRAAVIGAAAALVGLLTGVLLLLRGRRADEPARIERAYGPGLIPVTRSDRRSYDEIVEVESIETLARIAERYDRMILHEEGELGHSYRVADEGVLYVYLVGTPEGAELPRLLASAPPEALAEQETVPEHPANFDRGPSHS